MRYAYLTAALLLAASCTVDESPVDVRATARVLVGLRPGYDFGTLSLTDTTDGTLLYTSERNSTNAERLDTVYGVVGNVHSLVLSRILWDSVDDSRIHWFLLLHDTVATLPWIVE